MTFPLSYIFRDLRLTYDPSLVEQIPTRLPVRIMHAIVSPGRDHSADYEFDQEQIFVHGSGINTIQPGVLQQHANVGEYRQQELFKLFEESFEIEDLFEDDVDLDHPLQMHFQEPPIIQNDSNFIPALSTEPARSDPPALPPFKCRNCNPGAQFYTLISLEVHAKQARHKPFLCKRGDCRKAFARRDTLSRHISQAHKNTQAFACRLCPQGVQAQG